MYGPTRLFPHVMSKHTLQWQLIATLRALIFVRGMYGTGGVSIMDEQRVRLYSYV